MLYEPNNALIAEQLAAKSAMRLPPRSDWRAETVQLNPAEEYGRLTSSRDYLRHHELASEVIGALGGIVEDLQQASAERERVYRQERCE